MATDIASLAIKIENGDVIKTTTSLNSMEVAGTKAEASATRLTRRMALLEIQAREMDASMAKNATTLGRLKSTMENVERVVPGLTGALGALSAAAAIGFIGHKTIEETEQAQAAMAQLEAAVKSTGGAAGRTVAQLDELSLALQKQTVYSDEAVKGAEAILLTFDKIKGDTFDRATRDVTDLAARLGKDLPEAALQVGKALQDPIQGLQALQRLGVRLSASQKETIQDLVDTGHAADAMGIILTELERKFGGSAAAARDTLGGALAGLKNAWGDLFEVSGRASQGTVDGINAITKSLQDSGLSMNQFVLNTVVGWEKIKAAAEEANEVMSLQVGPGFFERARAISQRIQVDLSSKLAALNTPAKIGPAVTGNPSGAGDLSEEARKFEALVQQRQEELGKLTALNAAYRENGEALKILGLEYDAQIQKSHDVEGHTARQRAILDALTDATTRQKIAQIQLNAELEREAHLQAARNANTGTIEEALHARDRSGLAAPDEEIQAIRDRATEEMAAARRAHDEKTRLSAADQAAEDQRYREEVARIRSVSALQIEAIERARQAATDLDVSTTVRDAEQQTAGIRAMMAAELEGGKAAEQTSIALAGQDAVTRALNDATARGTTITEAQAGALRRSAEEMERARIEAAKLQAVFRQVSDTVNQVFTDLFHGKNPLPGLAKYVEEQVIRGLSDAVARPLTVMIGKILGIEAPASQQEKAARVMKEAADRQYDAAQIMAGASPGGDVATQQFAAQFTDSARPTPTIAPSTGARPGTGTGETSKSALDILQAKLPESLARALAGARVVVPPALAGYGIGYGTGQAVYSTSHSTFGNEVRGALGGAAAGALAGSAFGPVGTAVGAVTGFIGGILGVGHAAKDAAKQTEELRKALSLTMDDLRATVGKDALASSIAQVNAQREQIRKQIEDAYSGGGANSDTVKERNRQLAELNRLEDERIRQLKEEAASMQQRQVEDYKVRELRAQGRTKEADDLAFSEQQQREREDLVRSFGDEIDAKEQEILAAYDAAAAAEKTAHAAGELAGAFNDLTTSVRGGPSGFKLAGYIQEFATGRPFPTTLGTGLQVPQSPQFSLASSSTGKVATAPVTLVNPVFNFPNITDGKAAAKAFLGELDKTKNAAFGLNGTRAQALERM